MRLLTLKIHEPLPGRVLPEMAAEVGDEEASRRYRAIVVTTLRQLRGLTATRLRLLAEPEDAEEAVRFWLLPRLGESWLRNGAVFHTPGWEIDFGAGPGDFAIHATGEILCPWLGARWVHAAMVGLGRTTRLVTGHSPGGLEYFRATAEDATDDLHTRQLPELPVIREPADWDAAADSALGPALKRAWESEG